MNEHELTMNYTEIHINLDKHCKVLHKSQSSQKIKWFVYWTFIQKE